MNSHLALENHIQVSPIGSLGQYQLTQVICHGGMATVYKAYQPSLDRHVAIKMLLQLQHPDFTTRFKREAWAIAHLQHPNIVPIYDYGEQEGILYLVLQYIENATTLNDMLSEPIELTAALRLTYRLLAVLNYAHRHGVIHRDLKPANIMMPSPSWPMLTDFGIAKIESESERLTLAGLIIGTPAYIAPEQATGKLVDARTDLYAAGVVLYEMLTGQLPFDGDNATVLLTKHIHEAPLPPRHLNPSLPASVESFVLRALEKDPAARYQSAAEMARHLERIMLELSLASSGGWRASRYQAGMQPYRHGRCDPATESLGQHKALGLSCEAGRKLLPETREVQEHVRRIGEVGQQQAAMHQIQLRPQIACAPWPSVPQERRASTPAVRPIAQSISGMASAPYQPASRRSAKHRLSFMSGYALLLLALLLFVILTNSAVLSDRSPVSTHITVRPTQPASPTIQATVEARGPLATSKTEAARLSAPQPAPSAVLVPTPMAVILAPHPQPTETAEIEQPVIVESAPADTLSDEADGAAFPTAEPAPQDMPTDVAPSAPAATEEPTPEETPTDEPPTAEPAATEEPTPEETLTDEPPTAESAPEETATDEPPAMSL